MFGAARIGRAAGPRTGAAADVHRACVLDAAAMTAHAIAGRAAAGHRTADKLGLAGLAAAVAQLVAFAIHVTHGTFDDRLDGAVDYLNDIAFTVALLGGALCLLGLRRTLAAPRVPVVIAVTGSCLVAVGVLAGLVAGESPAWFAAAGVPGNLLVLGASIALAVWAWRSHRLPRLCAVGFALLVPVGLAFAEFGGTLLPAVLWAYLGLRLLRA